MHVHDEIVTEHPKGDNYYTVERLRELMSQPIPWCADMPMDAAGYAGGRIYRRPLRIEDAWRNLTTMTC
jgi:hypothetical protein